MRGAMQELREAKARLALEGDERAGTMRAIVEMSVTALPGEVQGAFDMLGAFAPKPATFGRDEVLEVWEVGEEEKGDGWLRGLVDRGLLEGVGDDRFAVHPVLADVACARLGEGEGSAGKARGGIPRGWSTRIGRVASNRGGAGADSERVDTGFERLCKRRRSHCILSCTIRALAPAGTVERELGLGEPCIGCISPPRAAQRRRHRAQSSRPDPLQPWRNEMRARILRKGPADCLQHRRPNRRGIDTQQYRPRLLLLGDQRRALEYYENALLHPPRHRRPRGRSNNAQQHRRRLLLPRRPAARARILREGPPNPPRHGRPRRRSRYAQQHGRNVPHAQ